MDGNRVVVIGGGAVGLATAFFLSERGVKDVTVLEADYVASASSGLSVGIIETQYMKPLDIRLRVRAMEFFKRLERDHGLDVVRNGYLRLARDEASLLAAEKSVEIQKELGVTDATFLGPEEIAERIPQMRCDDILGGLFGPSDGYIDGHLYCTLLAEQLQERGIQVKVKHKVTGLVENGRGYTVVTDNDARFECDYLVNAAGSWIGEISALVGIETPVIAQRHQAAMVATNVDYGYLMPSVMDYVPHSGDTGLYFRHERDGMLVAGLHSEEVHEGTVNPDDYHRSADQEFLELLAAKLESRLPGFPDAGLGDGWAGLYPISPDGLPQVGPSVGHDRFITVGGAGGSGIQLSPVLGEVAASWILDGDARVLEGAEAMKPGRPSLSEDTVRSGAD